jgi:hypothetical protein
LRIPLDAVCIGAYIDDMNTNDERLKRTNVHLSERIRKWLRVIQKKTGAPPAVTVRRILDEAMVRDQQK